MSYKANWTAALLMVGLLLWPSAAHADVFETLAGGKWKGNGKVAITETQRENIRCRASYTHGDTEDALSASLKCAGGGGFKIVLTVNLTRDATNKINGTWESTSTDSKGSLTGEVLATSMFLTARTPSSEVASIMINASGRNQTVIVDMLTDLLPVEGLSATLRK